MIPLFLLSTVLVLRIVILSSIKVELLQEISLGLRCITDWSTSLSNICTLWCWYHAHGTGQNGGVENLLCWFSILDNSVGSTVGSQGPHLGLQGPILHVAEILHFSSCSR